MSVNNLTAHSLHRNLALAGALFFCLAAIVVHLVRDDLSLWHRTLSMYAVGPAGWLLTLGFFAITGTQLLIAFRLFQQRQTGVELSAVILLSVAATGILLVAIFPYQIKLPHNTGAALQLGLFPVFLWLQSQAHRGETLWSFTRLCAALSTAFFLLLVWNGETDYNLGTTAMAQKGQIMVNTLWLAVYSWYWPVKTI